MTRNTWVPLLILLLLLMQSNWIQAFPNGSQVERVSELGFGFRAVTLAVPVAVDFESVGHFKYCLLYTSPSPRDGLLSRMPSSA